MTTWNPTDKGSNIILSNSNLVATLPTPTGDQSVRSTTFKTSGKWYFEIIAAWHDSNTNQPGIMTASGSLNGYPGFDAQGYGLYYDSGVDDWYIYFNNSSTVIGGFAASGDVIGVCLDLNNNFLYFTQNGTNLLGNPVAGTGGQAIAAGAWYAAVGGVGFFNAPTMTANFGASGFGNRLPAGFYSWDPLDTAELAVSGGVTTVGAIITRKFRVVGT